MSVDEMKRAISNYCVKVGCCQNCGLSRDDAPSLSNCFTHATDEEIKINYEYLIMKGDI